MYPLPVGSEVEITLACLGDDGEAVQIEGTPSWSSSDSDVVAVVPTEDPLTVTVQALGAVGQVAEVRVQDANGERTVEEIQIIGRAMAYGFEFGEPRAIAEVAS